MRGLPVTYDIPESDPPDDCEYDILKSVANLGEPEDCDAVPLKLAPPADAGKPGSESDGQQCPICCDEFTDPVITPCEHVFCRECVDEYLNRGTGACPVCRRELQKVALKPWLSPGCQKASADEAEKGYKESMVSGFAGYTKSIWLTLLGIFIACLAIWIGRK